MKKLIISIIVAALCPLNIWAQSSMTDSQVADLVQQEVSRGTSQAQIVTKLMQNGVDISQIRRVRKQYERQMNNSGLGTVKEKNTQDDRLRANNGKPKDTLERSVRSYW